MTGRHVLIIVVIVFAFFALAVVGGALFLWSLSQPVSVADGTVLEMTIGGAVTEVPPSNPVLQIFQPGGRNLFHLREALEHAARDKRVRAVYLEVRPLAIGFAELEEIREQIHKFRRSGKPVHAFLALDMAGEGEMYLASAADSISLNPGAGLLVNGLLAEVTFYKETLDKLRIKPEFIEYKEYKNPGTYTRERMTPEYRGMLEGIIRDLEQRFIDTVADERKTDPARIRQLMAQGIITDETALQEKLVDKLAYKHEVRDSLKFAGNNRDEYRGLDIDKYRDAMQGRRAASGNRVAYVAAEGIITAGSGESFSEIVAGNSMATLLRKLRQDKNIKGVILRINSPGGSVVGSEMVWEEVRMLEQEGKPVVVSMSGVAASGGYYIAMNAERIVSQASTITGSIGVIFGKFDLSGFYDWIGVSIEQVKLSPNADIISFSNSLSAEQRLQIEGWMSGVYQTFVSKVAKARNLPYEEMEPKARGRIYTGVQAKQAGLVDDIGGIDTAVENMRQALKLDESDRMQLVIYPRPKSLWETLASGDLWPVRTMPPDLREWVETEARSLSTPAPWILSREIRFH
jgi:protease IV